ncbi:MAG TPA: efflux RND transporter periplasmic adaptor subunit, partial [Candidatus Acidoferrum sp.]|nr:efflux RND transporter periplasmic adaptor subunit [Candidatus Acidoferrum sp.]
MRNAKHLWSSTAFTSLLAAAILVASLIAGCSKSGAGSSDEAAPEAAAAPATVTVTQVTRGDVSRYLQLTGSVAAPPNRDVKVSALVAGRVADVNVAEGDRVEAGQIIAKIDDHTYRDQVTQAEAAVAQAQANVENAKLNLARNEDLVQKGIAARKDLEDARTESAVSAAQLRQANAALSVAQVQVTRAEVHSPIAGTVVKRFVSVGEQVDGTAATPIVEVASLSEVELMANVPAADLLKMPVGTPVQLTSTALTGRHFNGHVVAVSQAVDPTTNAGLVRVRIPNQDSELKLGMFLSAQIPIETHTKVLTVPAGAIYLDENGNARVFKVDGENATAVQVKEGI